MPAGRGGSRWRVEQVVAAVGAGAFVAGTTWYALAVLGITVDEEPADDPSEPFEGGLRRYFDWFDTTLLQERLYLSFVILGFFCLALTVVALRDRYAREQFLGRLASFGAVTGSVVWAIGNVISVGGHRAAGVIGSFDDAVVTSYWILFASNTVDDALETFAFLVLTAGMAAVALFAVGREPSGRAWRRATVGVAVLLGAVAVAYLLDEGDAIDALLVVGGIVVLPAWLLLSARVLGPPRASA